MFDKVSSYSSKSTPVSQFQHMSLGLHQHSQSNYNFFSLSFTQSSGQDSQYVIYNNFRRGRNNLSQCQLCGKLGHIISTCWYRFNKNFVPYLNQSHSQIMPSQKYGYSYLPQQSSLPQQFVPSSSTSYGQFEPQSCPPSQMHALYATPFLPQYTFSLPVSPLPPSSLLGLLPTPQQFYSTQYKTPQKPQFELHGVMYDILI